MIFKRKNLWSLFILPLFVFSGLLLFTSNANATITIDDVELYYSADTGTSGLDEFSHEGNTTYTLIEDENNGATVATSSGKFGNAFDFIGNTGSYRNEACLRTANVYNDSNDEFAWSFWYKTNSTNPQGQAWSNYKNYAGAIGIRNNAPPMTYTFESSGWKDADLTDGYDADNTWHHVVVTGQYGYLSTATAKVYLDGSVIYTGWGNDGIPSFASPYFQIGGNFQGGGAECMYAYEGSIDDMAGFNRILTAEEVSDLYGNSLEDLLSGPDITALAFGYPNIWTNPSVFSYNGVKTYPIYYNTCNLYGTFNHASLIPIYSNGSYSPGNIIIEPIDEYTGPQECQGNYIFIDSFNETSTGDVEFQLVLYDADNNVVASTTSNIITFETGDIPDNFIEHFYTKPLNIDLGRLGENSDYTATTTRLYFNYNFVDHNSASTTVYMWDYTGATTTSFTTNGPFSSTSTSWTYIDIDTPTIATVKTYNFIASSPGYTTMSSKKITVNWVFYDDYIDEQYLCQETEIDYSGICEDIDTSTTYGNLVCQLKTAGIKAFSKLFYPSCQSMLNLKDSFDGIKGSFPFNVFFDLTETIKTSINSAKVASVDNNFSIPFIRQTATGTEYYMLPVMASSSFSNLIGENNYQIYLNSLGFLYWIAIAILIYFTVR